MTLSDTSGLARGGQGPSQRSSLADFSHFTLAAARRIAGLAACWALVARGPPEADSEADSERSTIPQKGTVVPSKRGPWSLSDCPLSQRSTPRQSSVATRDVRRLDPGGGPALTALWGIQAGRSRAARHRRFVVVPSTFQFARPERRRTEQRSGLERRRGRRRGAGVGAAQHPATPPTRRDCLNERAAPHPGAISLRDSPPPPPFREVDSPRDSP